MNAPLPEVLRKANGAVYFHARWSAPSVLGLAKLRDAMTARGMPGEAISVVDLDAHQDAIESLAEQGCKFGGWGEAAVIRDGKVTFFLALAHGPGVEARITKFLDEERA
jgi:hypothetical protein